MSNCKYEKGKKIESMSEFVNSESQMFMVRMGGWKPRARKFLENWQYGFLQKIIGYGWICEAKLKEDEQTDAHDNK